MARGKKATNRVKSSNGANLEFEAKLWQSAEKLHGHVDPGEYKHVVPDPDTEYYAPAADQRERVIIDPDEYAAENVSWVSPEVCWSYLQAHANSRRSESSSTT